MAGFQIPNDDDIIASINITPLVDIMLVLLIIFMLVSTVVDFSSIEINLPQAATGENAQKESIAIVVSKAGNYYVDGQAVDNLNHLVDLLIRKKSENPDLQAVISGDRKTYHENIVRIIDTVRKVGIHKFAINVEYLEDQSF